MFFLLLHPQNIMDVSTILEYQDLFVCFDGMHEKLCQLSCYLIMRIFSCAGTETSYAFDNQTNL